MNYFRSSFQASPTPNFSTGKFGEPVLPSTLPLGPGFIKDQQPELHLDLSARNLPLQSTPLGPPSTFQANPTGFTLGTRTFPTSNGYPLFAQGKNNLEGGMLEEWGSAAMGRSTVSGIGCAISSVAMGISGITGKTITPGQMNDFMNQVGGYTSGGGLKGQGGWDRMGELGNNQLEVKRHYGETFNADRLDAQLAKGLPVAVEVDYKGGPAGDHWILVTGRTADGTYQANDPAGGVPITLQRNASNQLEALDAANAYVTTGQAATFDPGPPSYMTFQPTPKVAPTPAPRPAWLDAPIPAPRPAWLDAPGQNPGLQSHLPQPSAEVEGFIREAAEQVDVD